MVKIRKRGSYETIEELIAARYEAPKASWKFNLKNAVDIIMEAVRNKEKISSWATMMLTALLRRQS